MISAINHRWIRAGFFPCAIAAQFLALRLDWVVNTESHRDLQTVKVRSGYAILLESTGKQGAETLFSYSGSAEHNHRMTLEIDNAKLSDESQRYIAVLNPPKMPPTLLTLQNAPMDRLQRCRAVRHSAWSSRRQPHRNCVRCGYTLHHLPNIKTLTA